MSNPVLHADFIALTPTAGGDDRQNICQAAGELTASTDVLAAGAIEDETGGDFDLVLFFALRDLGALERFGTDARYSRFLQGQLAPLLRGLAGANVLLEGELPPVCGHGACLALAAPPQTYDWEVRGALAAWAGEGGALGLAVGERGAYRGLALTFGEEPLSPARPPEGRFGSAIVAGRARPLP